MGVVRKVIFRSNQTFVREVFKKKCYLDMEIVPISSDTPPIETVSEYLDNEYWLIFLPPPTY